MRPFFRSNGPKMSVSAEPIGRSTPYENQRRRVRWMERVQAALTDQPVAIARESVARRVRLTPEQLINIRKGKLKGLYDDIAERVDDAFVAMAQRQIVDLAEEVDLALARGGRLAPRLVAEAEAARDSLEELIAEARGTTPATREVKP